MFKNSFTSPVHGSGNDTEPLDTYDLNCNITVPTKLETDRLLLVPFIPSLHAKAFYKYWSPDLEEHIPISLPTYQSFLDFIENVLRRDPAATAFVAIDKTKPADEDSRYLPGRVAGMLAYIDIAPGNLSLEIGKVITLPEFQRTFVTTHATGLLMKYALDLPSEGGLGFRRIVGRASPDNEASLAILRRTGYTDEAVLRYTWVLPEGKVGKSVDGRRGMGDGQDSVVFSICWDNWENSVKDLVEQRMKRVD